MAWSLEITAFGSQKWKSTWVIVGCLWMWCEIEKKYVSRYLVWQIVNKHTTRLFVVCVMSLVNTGMSGTVHITYSGCCIDLCICFRHNNDVIKSTMGSQIASLTIVYSAVYLGADRSKHHSYAPLVFVWGIHRWPVNSPRKWQVTQKIFPFDVVIMVFELWANLMRIRDRRP